MGSIPGFIYRSGNQVNKDTLQHKHLKDGLSFANIYHLSSIILRVVNQWSSDYVTGTVLSPLHVVSHLKFMKPELNTIIFLMIS